ncbi:MAG: tetratricopeptide repeat protein [Flavobacteriales bacterium]
MRILSTLLAAVLLAGCSLPKMIKTVEEINLEVTPSPVVLQGNDVTIDITGTFPPKYFAKKVTVEATPYLVWEGGEVAFESVNFQGEDAAGNGTVVSWENGKSFNYTSTVTYVGEMKDNARLELRMSGAQGDKTGEFGAITLAKGVMATQDLIQPDEAFVIAPDNFQRVITYVQDLTFNYGYQSSAVKSAEYRDEDWKATKDLFALAASADSVNVIGVTTTSYASPEGEISLNEDLAMDRAKSANKAVTRELGRKKLNLEDDAVRAEPKGEDWEGFKKAMRASDIADKDLILRVLEMYSDKNKREEEIKNIAKTYKEIENNILPDLRRSQVGITYTVEGYTDEELVSLAKGNADILTVEELLFAATLFDDLNDKLEVYQNTARVHADDYRGHNNVGVVLTDLGRMKQAEEAFNAAKALASGNGVVNTNLGAMARQNGDVEAAASYYGKASGGAELSYNKGVLAIAQGDYGRAISSMGGSATLNLALAKILNGDANGARTTLQNGDSDSAIADYLLAVCAARLDDAAGVRKHIRAAIDKDASLRNRALSDLEFRNHKEALIN